MERLCVSESEGQGGEEKYMRRCYFALLIVGVLTSAMAINAIGESGAVKPNWWKPYRPPCVERENVFEFVKKPVVTQKGDDKYGISFSVKGYCDVTVGIVDADGVVVRHLASGVLGSNAPEPFLKNSLLQTIYWDGKDDLDVYTKHPEELRLKISLGLSPVFDKLLGCSHPKNLPGRVWGVAADKDGVYVFVMGMGRGHITVRKFGHDTEYIATVWPPPANLPTNKLGGMGYVEYEKGKRSLHAPLIYRGTWRTSYWLPMGVETSFGLFACRPAVANGHIYFVNSGFPGDVESSEKFRVRMHYINTDGSTEYEGLKGWTLKDCDKGARESALVASPDGKNIYMVGLGGPPKNARKGKRGNGFPVLLGASIVNKTPANVLVGNMKKVGSDDRSFSLPLDVACDGNGRIYVADIHNNRVQIFSPAGVFLKTIKTNKPTMVQVHRKTGVVYILHSDMGKGKSEPRISRYSAFPAMSVTAEWNIGDVDVMTLDSWSDKPRLWISSEALRYDSYSQDMNVTGRGLRVYEDTGKNLKIISNFDEDAEKATGKNYTGRWDGGMYQNIECDPVREKVYYKKMHIYDLKTGDFTGWFGGRASMNIARSSFSNSHNVDVRGSALGDIAFDKHGYMHAHLNDGFDCKKVIARMDPDRINKDGGYVEVPYDYGVTKMSQSKSEWSGVIPGVATESETFSYGLGVNMQGDLAVGLRILYAPKMESAAFDEKSSDQRARQASGFFFGPNLKYSEWQRELQDFEKMGESLFYVARRPGHPLTGSVIMTHDRSGEVRKRPAVVPGSRGNGVQIDEEGDLYFTNARYRLNDDDKPFLLGCGGNYGGPSLDKRNPTPFTGTFIKSAGQDARFLLRNAVIPLTEFPKRQPELATPEGSGYDDRAQWRVWVEKAKWLYAGASPIVASHCDCPQMRVWLDWYKRSFVPEAYRHSIGILDANGNLITHVGQYGNFDSGAGNASKIPLGGDGIATTMVRYVSGTDNYMCLLDWGHRLIVAKLDYKAEAFAPITRRPASRLDD